MKILGIDYGTKRIGLAVSDETETLARELNILSPKEFWQSIVQVLSHQEVGKIVVGLPLNMAGSQTEKSREVEEFVGRLQKTVGLPIELMDERLSSSMAANMIGSQTNLDSLAAQIILQNYLDKAKKA